MTLDVSVIMSIYNEPLEYIRQSVGSILEQDFGDYELIIIVDNPDINQKIREYLDTMPSNTNVIYNAVNIGLALSMNKAAAVAKGKYLARMDADDISVKERLTIQFNEMEEHDYDLTCCGRMDIDENGVEIRLKKRKMNDTILIKNLPYCDTIIHPTVMMKKSVFDKAGGYRDFPCAQDYDLWLRFLSNNVKMHYIDKPLLFYRIRSNSISSSNNVRQTFTALYIKELYRERIRTGTDSFSNEHYNEYLKKHRVFDPDFCKKADEGKELKMRIAKYKSNKKTRLNAYILMFKLFLTNEYYRKHYLRMVLVVLKIM